MKLAITVALGAFAAGAAPAQPTGAPAPMQAPAREDISLSAAEARATASELAAKLDETYVFPDTAKRYAETLRRNAGAGAYDGLTSGWALADRLTADLRAVAPDNHLRVLVGPPPRGGPVRRVVRIPAAAGPASGPGAGPVPGPQAGPTGGPSPERRMMPMNPIDDQRWLAPGVAYIRFNLFTGTPEQLEAVRQFMAGHADAKTIIFDNRTHHGGGLAEMDVIFPYLFARQATLVTMDTRTSVDRIRGNPIGDAKLRLVPTKEDVVRREHFVEPSATEKRLFGAKVYVLTSGATASAAEHFTLALKRTHRATIVGEPTAGAGNYGGFEPLGGDKFSVFIPVGRTFDPDTGKGWEGGGIDPDVAVPADQALTEALVRSGMARPAAEAISAEVKPTGPMTRRNPRPS